MFKQKQNIILLSAIIVFLVSTSKLQADEQEPKYVIDLQKVVITASKIQQSYKHSTQNISIISKDDIESSGITEVTEIFDLLPSVDIIEYGSAGTNRSIHSRGTSSMQVLTLIDGRPINTPRDGLTDFNQIPLSNIERIEVLRGPASNVYGSSAVGGVINIVTKSGSEKMETSVLYKYGSFATNQATFTHGNKVNNFDYFITYDYLSSKGHRNNSAFINKNYNTKFGYQINDDNRISFSTGYHDAELGAPGLITNEDLDDQQLNFGKYFDLTYNGRLAKGQDILIKYYHNSDRLEFIESFNPIDKDTQQVYVNGFDSQLSQVFFDIFRTSIGFNYQGHKINSSTSNKHKYNLKGAYFESEVDVLERSSIKFGARWDDYSTFGDKISPSISFNTWLFDTYKIHMLTAKSFRAPTFNDLYWPREDWGVWGGVEGNEKLGPEKATSYEAGLSGYFFDILKTDITYFQTDIEDLIEWSVDNNFWWRPENISTARIKGGELETEFVISKHLKANFNYTYLHAINKDTKKHLIYRPQHLYKAKLIYSPIEKFEIGLNGIYKTMRYSSSDNVQHLNPYFIMNINMNYKINDFVQTFFEVKNLFNRDYMEERDYSMPGRSFYGGIKVSF